MQPLLDNLRRIGVVPVVGSAAASSGREVVIEQFTGYLIGDCGLAASTIVNYRAAARCPRTSRSSNRRLPVHGAPCTCATDSPMAPPGLGT